VIRNPLSLLVLILLLVFLPARILATPLRLPPVEDLPATTVSPSPARLPVGVFSTAAVETTWFGGTVWNADSSRWEAILGGTWTFDSGVGSSFEPSAGSCKEPALHSRMEGWTSADLTTSGVESRFRRLTIADFAPGPACVGSDAGLGGNASAWAGLLQSEADSLCWAAGQGYGNDWYVCIEKTFTSTGGDSVDLAYDYTNDTEPDYDYGLVLVDTTGAGSAPDLELVRYTGSVSANHAAWTLVPGATLPSGPGAYAIKFCATSDGAYSDEDGFNPTTCGAFAVDNIAVTGGGVSDLSDFETGDDGWTETHPCKGAGDFADIRDLSDLPAISGSTGPCDLSDSVLVFFDPETGGHPVDQHNVAISPWIDLEAAGVVGQPGKVVQFDFFADLPLQNYIFTTVLVQWDPDTCEASGAVRTSPFVSADSVYTLGSRDAPTCSGAGVAPFRVNFTSKVNPNATRMRIAVGVWNYCQYYPDCTHLSNTTPWLDNVRLGVYAPPPDIQDLIDDAADKDTVRVPAWTYTGPRNRDLDFHGKNLVLLGEGPDGTIIDCESVGRGFVFHSGEDSTTVVQGFTIRNGDATIDTSGAYGGVQYEGGGVVVFGGSGPTFKDCRITECSAYYGGGMAVAANSSVRLESCRFTGSTAIEGGGLYLYPGSQGRAVGTGFSANQAGAYKGGGLESEGSLTLDGCSCTGNTGGGAVGYLTASNSVFSGNTGSGVVVLYGSLTGCTISDNDGGYGGVASSYSRLTDCTITGNRSDGYAGGIYVVDQPPPPNSPGTLGAAATLVGGNPSGFEGCTVAGNQGRFGGAVGIMGGSPIFEGCTLTGNRAWVGGGVHVNGASPAFVRCILSGNCADTLDADEIFGFSIDSAWFHCCAIDTSGYDGWITLTYDGPQVFTDPLFCNPAPCENAPTADGDYHLAANSPCLPAASPCDTLIGALGEGCATVGLPGEKPPVVTRPLLAVFPNPFEGSLRIQYAVPGVEPPLVRIYTIAGRLVRELKPAVTSGVVTWDGRDGDGTGLPAGVYFVKMSGPGDGATQRVVLLR
jgi:hypothetical protein